MFVGRKTVLPKQNRLLTNKHRGWSDDCWSEDRLLTNSHLANNIIGGGWSEDRFVLAKQSSDQRCTRQSLAKQTSGQT